MTKLALCLFLLPSFAFAASQTARWSIAEKRMLKAGLHRSFVKALKKHYDPHDFNEVVELNTLLFLKKADYHGPQVNAEAAVEVHKFMVANAKSLQRAEKTYGVPGSVVASLLYMESRLGKNQGVFHVPSVFVDLLLADQSDVEHHLMSAAKRYRPVVTDTARIAIANRCRKRVKWALSELKAVQTMYSKDKHVLMEFNGSFAGAFGMPQFEPSSYVHYAKTASHKRTPDLERADDSIQSVAYYLHKSGWHADVKKSQIKALMKYNNSHDYAAAIIKLSRQARAEKSTAKRLPAGRK